MAPRIEGRDDVRMHQFSLSPNLGIKTFHRGGIRRHSSGQDLDGNLPIHGPMACSVDLAHASCTQAVQDDVFAQDRGPTLARHA